MSRKRYDPKGVSNMKNAASPMAEKEFRDKNYSKSRRASEQGRLLPTFSHSITSETITTFSDTDYLNIAMHGLDFGTANSKTGFKNLMIAMYKEGHTSGNMKDVVAAEETAFSVVALDSMMVLFELILQYALEEFLANPDEDDTDAFAWDHPTHAAMSSLALHVQTMERKGLVVPDCISAMLKELLFCIKIQSEYSVGAKVLPPRYFIPFAPMMVLANLQTYTTEWAQNSAQAKLHMDKFGIKYHQFSTSDIFELPEVSIFDSRAICYFSHIPLGVYDGAAQQELYPHYNLAAGTAWTGITFYFKDTPDECHINCLFPLFYLYDAANNPYGGILAARLTKATQGYFSLAQTNYDNSSDTWVAGSPREIMLYFLAMWKQTNTANVSITGTYFAADSDFSDWVIAIMNGYKKASGLTDVAITDIMKSFFISHSYGKGVAERKKVR